MMGKKVESAILRNRKVKRKRNPICSSAFQGRLWVVICTMGDFHVWIFARKQFHSNGKCNSLPNQAAHLGIYIQSFLENMFFQICSGLRYWIHRLPIILYSEINFLSFSSSGKKLISKNALLPLSSKTIWGSPLIISMEFLWIWPVKMPIKLEALNTSWWNLKVAWVCLFSGQSGAFPG